MTQNPYAPPTADVADVAIDRPTEMPLQVLWAVRALWASIIVNVIAAIVYLIVTVTNGDSVDMATLLGSVFGVTVWTLIGKWFIGKIIAGRNWARILMLVYTLLGFVAIVVIWVYVEPRVLEQVKIGVTDLVSGAIQQLLAVVALWWVFTSPGRDWFR